MKRMSEEMEEMRSHAIDVWVYLVVGVVAIVGGIVWAWNALMAWVY